MQIDNADKLKALATEFKTANPERQVAIRNELITAIALGVKKEATEMVMMFENDELQTTQNNYGKYMQALSGFQGIYFTAMVKAMKDAGAGQGLDSAIAIIKG